MLKLIDAQNQLRCVQVRDETHDVKSFIFTSPTKTGYVFKPGQFITLELEINGESINRCYTISSAPTRPYTISITVKRVSGGPVSNWLHDNLRAGDAISFLPAAGEFTNALYPAEKYLFLSGGSGITPLMSMTRTHYDMADDQDIVFIHNARTPDDIIFERELALIAHQQKNFRAHFICERAGQRVMPTGYLTLEKLKAMAPDFMDREIFVCGPASYMKAVRDMLTESGFDFNHYHEESFSFETLAIKPVSISTAHFTVNFAKTNRDIQCGSEQHVLEAADIAGLRLPSSCKQGLCGTCKVKLISGKVDMQHKGGIRQREIDQGMVLLCCSKPLTDLVVDK